METSELERRVMPIRCAELRVKPATDDKPATLSGYAAVFNQWSEDLGWFREKIAPGAFANCLKTSDVRALFNHDSNFLLGRTKSGTLKLTEDEKGLRFECDLADTQAARDVTENVKRGDLDGCSFAFTVQKDGDEWVYNTDGSGPDERTITEFRELFDVGPVVYPAYPQTSVDARGLEVAKRSHERGKSIPKHEQRTESTTPALDSAKQRMAEAKAQREAEAQKRLDARLKRHASEDAFADSDTPNKETRRP